MPWWLPLIVANAGIQYVEYTNRRSETWQAALPQTLLPIIISQWGLFYGWRHAPSLLTAWAFYTLGNSMARCVTSFLLGEHFSYLTPLGIGVMFAGSTLVREGMRQPQ
jgi:hypothetical protein